MLVSHCGLRFVPVHHDDRRDTDLSEGFREDAIKDLKTGSRRHVRTLRRARDPLGYPFPVLQESYRIF